MERYYAASPWIFSLFFFFLFFLTYGETIFITRATAERANGGVGDFFILCAADVRVCMGKKRKKKKEKQPD